MQTEAVFEGISKRIEKELKTAQSSIYIAVAWFTNRNLFDVLLEKAQDGIHVQLMLSNDHINTNSHVDHTRLRIKNSAAYLIGDGDRDLMHNKFCVIDGDTVINGSYNWSYKAERNHESIVITKGDNFLAEQFIEQFKKICGNYYHEDELTTLEIPIQKIVKRAEILKNYIILEDEDDILRENEKLKEYKSNVSINNITQAIDKGNFSRAAEIIEEFVSNNNSLIVHEDVNISALKLEIRQLEHQLKAYDDEKIELEKTLTEFYSLHTQELKGYMLELIHLRKQRAKDNPESFAKELENEKRYKQQVEKQEGVVFNNLNDEDKKTIKKVYRQASQICHPDRVSEDMKDIAQEIFIQLNEAYNANDLKAVKRIKLELKERMFKPRSETVNEKEQLNTLVKSLRYKLDKVEESILSIKNSSDYQSIMAIEDWGSYFDMKKQQLIAGIERLKAVN